jgi:AcrR family transcriptional regulator
MDNVSRSERTRNQAIQAALTIIARDGPGRLTLDAIAREGGLSKGGLMHQFPNKEAVLKALLQRQNEYFESFFTRYLAQHGAQHRQPHLAGRIAAAKEAMAQPDSIAFALLGVLAQEPGLLSVQREIDAVTVSTIKAEAPDPELALLRLMAARGLVMTYLFGFASIPQEESDRLFERLLDDSRWTGLEEKPAV